MEIEGVVLTPIPSGKWDFSNYFCDTENGKVYSELKGDFIVANPNANGYSYVNIRDNNSGEYRPFGLHRVVMSSASGVNLELFKRGGIEVDHLTPVSLGGGNEISNLQMTDRKGQYKESTLMRMRKPKPRLKESEVCEILEQLVEWKESPDNKLSDFIWMMSEAYNIGYRGMWNIVNGKSYIQLHGNI